MRNFLELTSCEAARENGGGRRLGVVTCKDHLWSVSQCAGVMMRMIGTYTQWWRCWWWHGRVAHGVGRRPRAPKSTTTHAPLRRLRFTTVFVVVVDPWRPGTTPLVPGDDLPHAVAPIEDDVNGDGCCTCVVAQAFAHYARGAFFCCLVLRTVTVPSIRGRRRLGVPFRRWS